MNKRLNTVLLVFLATVLNLVVMASIYFGLVLIYGRYFAPEVAPQYASAVLVGLFLVAATITYIGYYQLMKALAQRLELDRYFDPIFPKPKEKGKDEQS